MAPRSTKAKKAETKVTENEAPRKGRGRGKNVVDLESEAGDMELNEKPEPVTDKKTKRGKKAADSTSDVSEVNDKPAETEPPAKKGRKKKADSSAQEKPESNGDESAGEESQAKPDEDEENVESNGHTEEPSSGRGRKKLAKKEPAEKAEPKSGRGKRNAKQDSDESPDAPKEVDSKPASRGRGRKAAKVEIEPEPNQSDDDEPKKKPASKGRKKGPTKAAPEKMEAEVDEDDEVVEEKPESKKKEPKGKKHQGKHTSAKEETDDKDEIEEDSSSKKKKTSKKDEKAKVEAEDAEDDEVVDVPEAKPTKGKRGQKKVVEATPESDDEPLDASEPTSKRRRKVADDKASSNDKQKAPAKNKSLTNFDAIDFSNTSKNSQDKEWNFKISSWNVGGIRAWLSKGCLDYVQFEKPDILCVQEVKCAQDKLPDELTQLPGYHAYWLAGEKDGYAGVGIYTTKLAMNVTYGLQNAELDNEGRVITAEYEQFYLVCTYVPNSGRKLVTLPKRLEWNEEFRKHVKELDKKKPVIICGDMNVSHQEIDLANPKTNRKNAGFTDEERAGMTDLIGDGFVDTYRHLYPDKTGAYTFWTYMMNSRARNVGWRLDYFIISERLLPSLCDSVIRDKVYGSDHCPLTLFLHLRTADKPKE